MNIYSAMKSVLWRMNLSVKGEIIMMQRQSLDFIVGYLFNSLDKSIFKHFSNHKSTLVESHCVPKIWFGLSSSSCYTNDVKGEIKYQLKIMLEKVLQDLYPQFKTEVVRIVPEKQYLRFDFKITPIPEVKKMTVEEIEEALGYKIEIVSDK